MIDSNWYSRTIGFIRIQRIAADASRNAFQTGPKSKDEKNHSVSRNLPRKNALG
jgi:hypothetical protein